MKAGDYVALGLSALVIGLVAKQRPTTPAAAGDKPLPDAGPGPILASSPGARVPGETEQIPSAQGAGTPGGFGPTPMGTPPIFGGSVIANPPPDSVIIGPGTATPPVVNPPATTVIDEENVKVGESVTVVPLALPQAAQKALLDFLQIQGLNAQVLSAVVRVEGLANRQVQGLLVGAKMATRPDAAPTPFPESPPVRVIVPYTMVLSVLRPPAPTTTTTKPTTPADTKATPGSLVEVNDDVVIVADDLRARLTEAGIILSDDPVRSAGLRVTTTRGDGLLNGEIVRVTMGSAPNNMGTHAVSPAVPYNGFPRSAVHVVRRLGQVLAQTGTDATDLELSL